MIRNAIISNDGRHRWALSRCWGTTGRLLAVVMLNPSTADADKDDPTIRKVTGFAIRNGYSGYVVVNLFGYRATAPRALHAAIRDGRASLDDPENLAAFEWAMSICDDVLVAWGGSLRVDISPQMLSVLNTCAGKIWCLGYTAGHQPRHPLMLSYETRLQTWIRQ